MQHMYNIGNAIHTKNNIHMYMMSYNNCVSKGPILSAIERYFLYSYAGINLF